ncbi:MAG: hypothetical protein AMS22_06245 [Thiotrichales bacterium SG8_50]|nr:MAG: hypothetical protein AMS22_06245 [Thiotrichales bacterium SG8_50]
MLRDLAGFFRNLSDLVTEPIRRKIVRRFCRVLEDRLRAKTDQEPYKQWLNRDKARFVVECEIRDTVPAVPMVGNPVIERWADKWLRVEKFRPKGDPDADFRPITPEQNALRVTMIVDLKNLLADDLTSGK